MSILDLVLILLERKRLILITMAIVSVGAVVVSTLMTKYYTATAVILPSYGSSLAGGLGGLLDQLPMGGMLESLDLFGGTENEQTLSILDSRRLADRVITEFDLMHRYKFHKSRKWYYESLLKAYYKNLEVDESDLENITIAFTDTSPTFAARVVNYIVSQLDTITYEIAQTGARNSRLFFESRLQAIRADMDSAHNRFNSFRLAHGYLDLDQQLPATVQAVAEVEAEKMALDVQIDQLRNRFGEGNNRIAELRRNRAVLARRVDEYMKAGGGRLIIALDSAPELGVQYAHLLRDVKIQETLFNMVTQMYEQAKFVEINNTPVIKVLEYAQVPQKKRRPKRSIICILWFSVGLIGVSLYVLADKWLSVQREARTEAYLKIEQLWAHLRLRR